MTGTGLAEQVLALVGGTENVERVTHCFSRLRFVLHDDAVADDAAIGALPDVVMVLRQGGQLQVAVRSGVMALHAEVVALLA